MDALLEQFGLVNVKDELVKKLSGGLKQRLKIAITCIYQPKIILLDEPTNGLNPKFRKEFWDALASLTDKCNTTILLSSHDMVELERYYQTVIHLVDGKVAYYGSTDDLLRRSDTSSLEEYDLLGGND